MRDGKYSPLRASELRAFPLRLLPHYRRRRSERRRTNAALTPLPFSFSRAEMGPKRRFPRCSFVYGFVITLAVSLSVAVAMPDVGLGTERVWPGKEGRRDVNLEEGRDRDHRAASEAATYSVTEVLRLRCHACNGALTSAPYFLGPPPPPRSGRSTDEVLFAICSLNRGIRTIPVAAAAVSSKFYRAENYDVVIPMTKARLSRSEIVKLSFLLTTDEERMSFLKHRRLPSIALLN